MVFMVTGYGQVNMKSVFVRAFFILLALKANAAAAFVCCGSILILYVLLLHKHKRAEIEQISCLEILPCPAAVG